MSFDISDMISLSMFYLFRVEHINKYFLSSVLTSNNSFTIIKRLMVGTKYAGKCDM